MKLAAVAFSVAVSTFACASDIRDPWETRQQEFATPALEEAMDGEGVAHNAEDLGKCLDSAASAAQKVCGGGQSDYERQCRERKYDQAFQACQDAEKNSGQKQTTTIFSPFGGGQITGEKK